MYWKATAYGDELYFDCESRDDAADRLAEFCGEDIPAWHVRWEQVEDIPPGHEAL